MIMKDNEKKSSSQPGCHQEHLQVLNSLTESLKDELKRGLTLLDGCVNQLAQAKWILINVERTIENYYAECPACDKDAIALPVGNRAITPPTIVSSQGPGTSNATKKPRDSKAKKASVLPMVSGHTVQRPKINIARVDVRKEKKPKKEKEPASSSRVRSRGSGATALALATASTSAGRPVVDSGDEAPRNGINGPSPAKKKPGPMSKTRIKSDGPPEFTYDGICVSVDLDDVNELLSGQSSFQGCELNEFLKRMGLPLVKEKKKPKSNKSEKPSTSRSSVVEETVKKRKYGSDNSDASEDERSKKNSGESKVTSKESTDASKSSTTPKLNIPLNLNSAIKSKFLAFAAAKISAQASSNTDCKPDAKGESSTESPGLKPTSSTNSASVKTEVASSDSESENRNSSKRPSATNKKSKQDDSDTDTYSPKNKKPKQSRRVSHKSASSDDSEAEKAPKASKKSRKIKKNSSSDDSGSEYALSSPTSKKRSNTSRVVGRSGSKFKSKETVSSDSDDDNSVVSTKKKQVNRVRKTSRDESPDERPTAKTSAKSPERRTSKDEQSKRVVDSPERRSNVASKVNDSESDEPKPKSRPGPASSKAKRTGGRPGPLSAKLKVKEKQQAEKMSVDDSSGDDEKKKSTKSGTTSQVMFTDSDDSEIVKIKNKIPLNLQDAVRSPSPQTQKDAFSNLLASYHKIAGPPDTPLEKLKKQSKYVARNIFELNESVQQKLSSVGRELVPYEGPVEPDDSIFTAEKYYIVGKPNDEKLVMFDSGELQELDLSMDDVNDILSG